MVFNIPPGLGMSLDEEIKTYQNGKSGCSDDKWLTDLSAFLLFNFPFRLFLLYHIFMSYVFVKYCIPFNYV